MSNTYRNLAIAEGAIIVVASISIAIMSSTSTFQKMRATDSLNTYLSDLGLSSIKSSCNKDGDGDGYSSCSYNNGKEVVNLECDSALIFNANACKMPKHMFN